MSRTVRTVTYEDFNDELNSRLPNQVIPMQVQEQSIKGVFEIHLESHEDERGFFMRTYDDQIFLEHNLNTNWVQENHSFSSKKGTLRGLHFQLPPHSEIKLVRVSSGEVFFAYADLRKGSDTFGKWGSTTLSAENKKMIYVPAGFALGFCTLTENCTLLYKMGNYYAPESDGYIRWDDPDIGIEWPVDAPVLSEKDAAASSFADFVETRGGIQL